MLATKPRSRRKAKAISASCLNVLMRSQHPVSPGCWPGHLRLILSKFQNGPIVRYAAERCDRGTASCRKTVHGRRTRTTQRAIQPGQPTPTSRPSPRRCPKERATAGWRPKTRMIGVGIQVSGQPTTTPAARREPRHQAPAETGSPRVSPRRSPRGQGLRSPWRGGLQQARRTAATSTAIQHTPTKWTAESSGVRRH